MQLTLLVVSAASLVVAATGTTDVAAPVSSMPRVPHTWHGRPVMAAALPSYLQKGPLAKLMPEEPAPAPDEAEVFVAGDGEEAGDKEVADEEEAVAAPSAAVASSKASTRLVAFAPIAWKKHVVIFAVSAAVTLLHRAVIAPFLKKKFAKKAAAPAAAAATAPAAAAPAAAAAPVNEEAEAEEPSAGEAAIDAAEDDDAAAPVGGDDAAAAAPADEAPVPTAEE